MTRVPRATWAVVAIALATIVVVLMVSASSSDTSSRDPYATHANRLCWIAGRQIAATRRSYNSDSPQGPLGPLAESLARIVGDVRARLATLAPPPDRIEAIVSMEGAMLESEDRLIQIAQGRHQAAIGARLADAAAARVTKTASSVGLAACARLSLAVALVRD